MPETAQALMKEHFDKAADLLTKNNTYDTIRKETKR